MWCGAWVSFGGPASFIELTVHDRTRTESTDPPVRKVYDSADFVALEGHVCRALKAGDISRGANARPLAAVRRAP
jgi:hypothetical protein